VSSSESKLHVVGGTGLIADGILGYDIKINCFERATETGVLSNLCVCFKNCVWLLQKNETIRTNSEVIFRFSAKEYVRIS
jgi:hypothetical protein